MGDSGDDIGEDTGENLTELVERADRMVGEATDEAFDGEMVCTVKGALVSGGLASVCSRNVMQLQRWQRRLIRFWSCRLTDSASDNPAELLYGCGCGECGIHGTQPLQACRA